MSASTLGQQTLLAAVFRHWDEQFPGTIPTIYPGTNRDTYADPEWVELWVSPWSRPPQRPATGTQLDVMLTVHCFVRDRTDPGRIARLADAVRGALELQSLPVLSLETSEGAEIGRLVLKEAIVRSLTRSDGTAPAEDLQHWVVTCPGLAQSL